MKDLENEKIDINTLAGGAVKESVEYALEEVFENIKDPNTQAEKSRKLTITLELKPDESRQVIKTTVAIKTSLVPVNAINTQLLLDTNGLQIVAKELLKQNPNQISFDEMNNVVPLEKEREVK